MVVFALMMYIRTYLECVGTTFYAELSSFVYKQNFLMSQKEKDL